MSHNAADKTNKQGEFHPHVPRDEPLTTHGHKPGVLVGNDAAPSFHAETLPPGTAPADRTFKPQPDNEVPSQANNPDVLRSHGKESIQTTASDTLSGATSGDVYAGQGKPLQGQTSNEGKEREGGLVGVGTSGAPSGNMGVDERAQESQRGLEKEEGDLAGTRGSKGGAYGAGEMENETS